MKYILPNFYDSFIYNKLLKEDFFTSIDIEGIQGTYPFCIFNGGCNNIEYEEIALYRDLIDGLGRYGILGNKILLDFGNINLNKEDYVNTFGNLIIETFYSNSCFYFLISQEDFIEYLVKEYPNIQLILHHNYINFHTEQEVQKIVTKYHNNIKYIITTDLNECRNVKNVKKIYLLSLFNCQQCRHYETCINYDNNQTLNYSKLSILNTCEVKKFVDINILLDKINYTKNLNIDIIMFETIPIFHEEICYNIIKDIFEREITQNDLF